MTEMKNELELRIDQQVGLLNWNFDELNRQLDEQLKKYQGLQFSDAEMAEAKKTKAMLNHIAKEINDRKISVKKQFCAPYDAFAEQAKQLIAKINDCSKDIDDQVKAFEKKKDDEKRAAIEAYWKDNGPTSLKINLDQVWNEKWLNTTYSEVQWQDDIDQIAKQVEKDTDLIVKMPTDQMNFMAEDYRKTLDLGASLANWQRHLDDLQEIEELKQKAAAEAEARQKALEERQAKIEQYKVRDVDASPVQENKAPIEEYWAVMEVSGTKEQMMEMTDQIHRIGLKMHVQNKGKRTK